MNLYKNYGSYRHIILNYLPQFFFKGLVGKNKGYCRISEFQHGLKNKIIMILVIVYYMFCSFHMIKNKYI